MNGAPHLLAAPEPRHRGMMVVVLNGLASRAPGAIPDALAPAIAREDNLLVLDTARALHADLLAAQAVGDARGEVPGSGPSMMDLPSFPPPSRRKSPSSPRR